MSKVSRYSRGEWVGGGWANAVVGRTLGCVEGGGYLGCRGHIIDIGVGCSSDR